MYDPHSRFIAVLTISNIFFIIFVKAEPAEWAHVSNTVRLFEYFYLYTFFVKRISAAILNVRIF